MDIHEFKAKYGTLSPLLLAQRAQEEAASGAKPEVLAAILAEIENMMLDLGTALEKVE